MNEKQLEIMRSGKGFIAALDQSGGSTPKALAGYGIEKDSYRTDDEMFDLVHNMRIRIVTNPSFSSDKILGAILFERTMNREVEGMFTADYLWEKKGIVPFLKVDRGLAETEDGVQLMKQMPKLPDLLNKANEKHIFGTKMRSVIKEANPKGIQAIVDQQFELGKQILAAGLMPILEPEVDIKSEDKAECEVLLKEYLLKGLDALEEGQEVIFKLTIPSVPNFYEELINHPKVVRVVALSGGHSQAQSNELLAQNHGLIASFSRALLEGLSVEDSDEAFTDKLGKSVEAIYNASNA